MCWFEDSVNAEAPRKDAPVPHAPRASTPPLPVSPPLNSTPVTEIPDSSKDVQSVSASAEIVLAAAVEIPDLRKDPKEAEIQTEGAPSVENVVETEEVTNMETYSIETDGGRRLEIACYVNSAGIRMVEIHADSPLQMKLSTLEHCITTMVQSAARVDETERLEQERQKEFDACSELAFGFFIVFIITLAIGIYVTLIQQSVAAL